jgi:hypothetical protein
MTDYADLSAGVQALVDAAHAKSAHPVFCVSMEDGFSQYEEIVTIDLYRDLLEGYPREYVQNVYFGAYGGMEGFDKPEDLWEGENFNRFTEQDFAEGPSAWLVEDHNIVAHHTI